MGILNCVSYNESIEMANHSYDYLWLSSAKEGLACTMILMDFLQTDIGVSSKQMGHLFLYKKSYTSLSLFLFFLAHSSKTFT